MRQHIDSAAARKLIREKLFLGGLAPKDFQGQPIPGEAFGAGACDPEPILHRHPSMQAKDYFFGICMGPDTDSLLLTLDAYSAKHGPFEAVGEFDLDAWEAQKVYLWADSNRDGFRALSRVARGLLNGRSFVLPDGTRLDGIRKAGC